MYIYGFGLVYHFCIALTLAWVSLCGTILFPFQFQNEDGIPCAAFFASAAVLDYAYEILNG